MSGFRRKLLGAAAAQLAAAVFAAAGSGQPSQPGPAPEIEAEVNVPKVELHRIRLLNAEQGPIEVSDDRGATWQLVGHVVQPAERANEAGYTASKWAKDGCVAATAVNDIHIRVRLNEATGRGVIFSIAPCPLVPQASPAAKGTSAIVTDIPGGTGIFALYAPYVGNPVLLEQAGEAAPLPHDYVPRLGDRLDILVLRPARVPFDIVFENRFGGLIYVRYLDNELGPQVPVGTVLRPVVGIGRFEGSVYADVGRVRANHCGVIDISTSPYGQVGGFQIVPKGHAQSPENYYVREATQWMVVGPISALDPSWEGIPPLFADFITPAFRPNDLDYPGHATDRLLWMRVEVKIKGGPWQEMPSLSVDPNAALPEWAGTALRDVTAIRLRFPIYIGDLLGEAARPRQRKAVATQGGCTHGKSGV